MVVIFVWFVSFWSGGGFPYFGVEMVFVDYDGGGGNVVSGGVVDIVVIDVGGGCGRVTTVE